MPVGPDELNVFCLPHIKVKSIVTEIDNKVSSVDCKLNTSRVCLVCACVNETVVCRLTLLNTCFCCTILVRDGPLRRQCRVQKLIGRPNDPVQSTEET